MSDALFYRDEHYGALGLVRLGGARLGLAEHRFIELECVLGALAAHGTLVDREGSPSVWALDEHVDITLARIGAVLRRRGFADDPLGARAVSTVNERAAISPDLPVAGSCHLHAAVEDGFRAILVEALSVVGSPTGMAVHAFPRSRVRDVLPFVRLGATLDEQDAVHVQGAVRGALGGLGQQLVRATAVPAGRGTLVELGVVPSRALTEALNGRVPPTFQAGACARVVAFTLGVPLTERALSALRIRFMEARAVTLVERAGDVLALRVPAAQPGDPLGDAALRERTAWLSDQLAPWRPELTEITDLL